MPYTYDGETGQQVWSGPGPEIGSPWANNRSGWSPENIDAIFNEYAKSEAGNVGTQTLEGLRRFNVSPDVSLNSLWEAARGSANPNWAGGSPTGISRDIWSRAGILSQIDNPQLRAAQQNEDQSIWAGQQQGGDDWGFLGPALGVAGAAFGMPWLGTAFNALQGKFNPLGIATAAFGGLGGAEGLEGFGTEYQGDFGYPDDFSSSFGTTYQGDYGYEGDTPSFGGTEYQGDFGYEGDTNFAPVEDRSTMFDPRTQRPLTFRSLQDTGGLRMGTAGDLLSGGSALGNLARLAKGTLDVGSGALGLRERKRLQEMAEAAMSNYRGSMNPVDYYAKVRELMSNPGSVSSRPGYQFGLDEGRRAIQRRGAASGSGGNEDIALARYTPEYAGKAYDRAVAEEMALASGQAGAAQSRGNTEAQMALDYGRQANDMYSRSLASIGSGAAQVFGGNSYEQLINQMLARAFGGNRGV